MNTKEIYQNNPLQGVKLETILNELVDHYGWEILFAYLSINCFKMNPSIPSSLKFLRKSDWAKEKVEAFYMYKLLGYPKADDIQFQLPPRDRIVPEHHKARGPVNLSLEDAQRIKDKKSKTSYKKPSTPSNPWGQ
ncbi:VF530 family DNA-binding protein [Pseudoalteromonas denitrificans]|uniref:Uncharacterized conserved protein n=1 Tax=Pseudoalteromonas denitrificans DSM 6059 TaxID=1123010 RepID=A0A1I1UDX4_9GAMM|nr:VF530 family protein [Pseudoalteromonas denitrificans]SFD69046.1 Uncharacterized conserved protein [Pseudoalteromonas denitrificans DSM 6059]